jgi:hypothetical protein
VHFERVFKTENEATTLAIEFRFTGSPIGEAWIDDIELRYEDTPPGP